MLRKEHFADMWCPHARISIQKVESGGVKAVETGAFNQVLLSTQQTYLTARCVGDKCPHYRHPLNPWGWGRCGMAPQWVGKHIIGAAFILAAALILLTIL